ncbi:MAG TPA: MxcI, partial [Polyangia bacterium]
VSLVESLSAPRKLDYSKSLEMPGRARLYAYRDTDFFALGGGEAPTITRYAITPQGGFVQGAVVSFAQHGVKAMGAQAVLFLSPTKAYFKDPDQNQVIVWNPETMTVTKVIPLPKELVPASVDDIPGHSQWAARPGEAFFSVTAYTKVYDRAHPGAVLVRIDTATDSVTTTTEPRCRGFFKTASLDGTLYFFSDVINGFGHAVSPNVGGQADCFLRISPGRAHFDDDFAGTFTQALGAHEIATAIALTEDGRVWLQVADLAVTPKAPGTKYTEWYSKGWTWAAVRLSNLTAAERVPGAPGPYEGNAFTSGADFFISQGSANYAETSLVNLSGGTPVPGLSFAGFALDVARIR